jgi:hypothetical protein
VIDVDELQFWEAVKTNQAFHVQVLDGNLYYGRPVVRHVPARDGAPESFRRTRRARQLVVDRVTVLRGDYNMEGGKVRDLLMAKVHTREVGGEGGISFLMIRFGNTWWVGTLTK